VNRRVLIILILTIFILIFLSNNAKAQQSNSIIVLNLNMQIDPGSDKFISDGLAYAQANGYNVVVIQMNTPGGFLNSMLNIVNNIQAAESKGIKIYTYVPPGGLAASAGSYIAMATEGIYMARGTEIGPSTPIVVGGTQLEQQHVQNAMLALMEGLAQKYGRNVTAVIPMVTNNTAYSAETAYKIHVIEGIADNFNQFLSLINMTNAQVTILNPSFYDQFLSVISNPTVEGLFITIGLLAILLDIYHPTILLTVIGIILISIGLYGAQLIQASILAIILFIIAAALIILEIKTGHGILLLAGAVLSAFATLLLVYGVPYSPSPITDLSYAIFGVIIALGVIVAFYLNYIRISIKKKPKAGPESLIGKEGIVYTTLEPEGEVRVEGIIWRAKSKDNSKIEKGQKVRVVKIEGLTLMVEKIT